jgi:hypothetical protein
LIPLDPYSGITFIRSTVEKAVTVVGTPYYLSPEII